MVALFHRPKSVGTSRRALVGGGLALAVAIAAMPARAEDNAPVRIGFSIARTGPNAVAAQGGVEANYTLWSEQVNAAGGLNVKGQKRRIELVGYDDQSEVETSVRTYEKLMADDKVDLIRRHGARTLRSRSDRSRTGTATRSCRPPAVRRNFWI
jgi:branched-chain amino acid transport system substrate-binding protein